MFWVNKLAVEGASAGEILGFKVYLIAMGVLFMGLALFAFLTKHPVVTVISISLSIFSTVLSASLKVPQ